jgi:hypothetical protein
MARIMTIVVIVCASAILSGMDNNFARGETPIQARRVKSPPVQAPAIKVGFLEIPEIDVSGGISAIALLVTAVLIVVEHRRPTDNGKERQKRKNKP